MIKRGEIFTHFPKIEFDKKNIKYKNEIKYLGLIFDRNLSWNAHINYLKDKIYKLYYKLKSMIRKTWGLKPQVLKMIYKCVIEKIITYVLFGIQLLVLFGIKGM